jgi:hypothetical protein
MFAHHLMDAFRKHLSVDEDYCLSHAASVENFHYEFWFLLGLALEGVLLDV